MNEHEDILDTYVNRAEGATRGAAISNKGKTRVTIYLDDVVIDHFRDEATKKGCGYQTLINASLRSLMDHNDEVMVLDHTPSTVELQLRDISGTLQKIVDQIGAKATIIKEGKMVAGRNMVRKKGGADEVIGGFVNVRTEKPSSRNSRFAKVPGK